MWQNLRELDRKINYGLDIYDKIFFPESYLLEKGFSKFSMDHPQHCDGTYMRQEDGDEKLNKERTACICFTKEWCPRKKPW